MAIDVGDTYRCSFTNTSPSGGLVSSGDMKLTVILPDDTQTVIDPVTPISTGVYQYDFPTTQPGRHVAQWQGTGAGPGAYVEIFDVRTLTPGYLISLAAAKKQLRIPPIDTTFDEDIRGFIESATDAVERIRGEAIVKQTITEEHEVRTGRIALNKPPVVQLVSVVSTDGVITWPAANLLISPAGVVSTKYLGGFLSLDGFIRVVYKAGYQIIPESFITATGFIVEHLWQTRRGSKGSPTVGGVSVPGIGFLVPYQAMELLGNGTGGFA
jgi:hypothetical protein